MSLCPINLIFIFLFFLAFVLVIDTDWEPQIKRYSVYSQNKCWFDKLPRNFWVHVSQHWTGIEMVPCSCSHSHSDIPTTSTKPAEMTHILWDDNRIFSKECHRKLKKAASLLAMLILLSWKHCPVSPRASYAAPSYNTSNLGIVLYTYSYKLEQDLIHISHSASYAILVTKDLIMLVTWGLFHQEECNSTTSELSLL